jgi:hypothetical protein
MSMHTLGTNARQAVELAEHKKHIQALWRHIERLEKFIKPTSEGLMIKVDRSEILIMKNGAILLDGRIITLKVPNRMKMMTSSGDL